MTAPAESIFDSEDVSRVERATLGERAGLRPDLKPVKTLRGWVGRANLTQLPIIRVAKLEDIPTAGLKQLGIVATEYARSTMNVESDGSRTIRKGHHTELTLTSKEAMICPNCGIGYIHPKTWMCNGGHPTETRCGTQQTEAHEVVTRPDVANRYEPKCKNVPFFAIENGELILLGFITVTRRGGSDKAQNNPEKWQTIRRRVKGESPKWGNYNNEKSAFRFGMIAVEAHIDGKVFRTFATIAFDEQDSEAMTARGVSIQSRGVNLFDREVTE